MAQRILNPALWTLGVPTSVSCHECRTWRPRVARRIDHHRIRTVRGLFTVELDFDLAGNRNSAKARSLNIKRLDICIL
jgi:hypothetical protein